MMQHLQYNPSQCIECGECLLLCPVEAISSVSPLTIENNCIECEVCINSCPKGQKVLRNGKNDELGGGWISPFDYQASTNPSEPKKDDTTSENPSNPSDKDSSEESKGESSQEPSTKPSTDNPTTPTKPTISPEIDSIYAPPQARYKQA